ncbi:MAG: D-alanyl-D-alanine carboxypeptidase/D-alanyl-D-alanine-endopeptidase [Proteobacteria bacterium]|nr:D-alanyl-D-alanine carboxypeptidase/D-alanyl-D-alanine-endopeptidase [Pseudomonadota bacterium]
MGKIPRILHYVIIILLTVWYPTFCLAENHIHKKHTAHHHHTKAKKPNKKSKKTLHSQRTNQPVEEPIDTNLQRGMDHILSKVSPHAHMGVIVETVDGRELLYQHNADVLFTPASVNKLFVAVASLAYLKPDYHFETRLLATGQINQGVLNGDLYVQFNGDPTLTDKQLIGLLNQLTQMGIKQISGHVYLDNTAYGSAAYAPGWLLHDLIFGYAAPLNAVILNENRFAIIISPSNQTGRSANVTTSVPSGVVKIDNHTITQTRSTSCPLSVYSDNESIYHITGCIAKIPSKQYFAVALRDPVVYAKVLIANGLKNENINFSGGINIQRAPTSAVTLTLHQSPPLNLIVKTLLKESDNLYTNSILKQIGKVYYQTQGTWQNGLSAVKEILSQPAAIDFNQIHLFDGSGLSRYDLVSPRQIAKLLRFAYRDPKIQPDLWQALPIAGQDGTLRGRLSSIAKGDIIHAKTGTMKNSGVSALAGYMKTRNHGLIVFVIMTNGLEDTRHVYKYTEDKICKLLLNAY